MRLRLWAAVLLTGLAAPLASADPDVHAVDPSSAEGETIVASAVKDLARQLGVPAGIAVRRMRAAPGWAFVSGEILGEDGQPIDYAGTRLAQAAADGGKSKTYVALLAGTNLHWGLVTSRVGPTDAVEQGWSADYDAPAALFAAAPTASARVMPTVSPDAAPTASSSQPAPADG